MWSSFCWDLALASNSCIVFHAGWILTFCGALPLRVRADRKLSHVISVLYTDCWTTIIDGPPTSAAILLGSYFLKVHVDNLSPGRSCLMFLLVVSNYIICPHEIFSLHTYVYIYMFLLKAQRWTNKMAYLLYDSLYSCCILLMSAWPSSWTWSCWWSSVQQMPRSYEMPTTYAYVCI